MATTIKVNGATITLGNNAVKAASSESYDFEDVYAKAVESAVMVDVMNTAVESMAIMSTEGEKLNKFKEGVKKVWQKIAEFFANIARSIQAFFMGTGLKMRAKSLSAKLAKGGINGNWKNVDVSAAAIVVDENTSNIIKVFGQLIQKISVSSTEIVDKEIATKLEQHFAKVNNAKTVNIKASVLAGKLGLSESNIKAALDAIASGAYKDIKEAIVAKDEANKKAKEANALAKGDSKEDKKEKRKAYSAAVKANNLKVKYLIGKMNCTLKLASLMTKKEKPAKDENK